MQPFNKLSPAQAERLDFLAEECAEVIQAISKIKRHGYNSLHYDAKADLEKELGHVFAAATLLCNVEEINFDFISAIREDKLRDIEEDIDHASSMRSVCRLPQVENFI